MVGISMILKSDLDRLIFEHYKSIKKLKSYIRKYPNGKNVSEAKDIIKKKNKVILIWILCVLIPSTVISLL